MSKTLLITNLLSNTLENDDDSSGLKNNFKKITEIFLNFDMRYKMTCRVCGESGTQKGLLFHCDKINCGSVHWNKSKVLKLRKEIELDDVLRSEILHEAGVPILDNNNNHHFVYILRLRGQLRSRYVGLTGLHPFERYFNHIRGYRASRIAKKKATALVSFEGPMSYIKAQIREPELAEILRLEGFDVHGGH